MKIKKSSLAIYLIILLTLPNTTHAFINLFKPTTAYFKIDNFRWIERENNNALILRETGHIPGLGIEAKHTVYKELSLTSTFEVFSGEITYDGQTQDGTPCKTKTIYKGFQAETNATLWSADYNKTFFGGPSVGIGYRSWSRNITSTEQATGYTENWSTIYLKIGPSFKIKQDNQNILYFDIGAKLSLSNTNEIDLATLGLPKVNLKPGYKTSYFAKLSFKSHNTKTMLYYEKISFRKSNTEIVENNIGEYIGIHQPLSYADIYGINIGIQI
jgi:hypothetical protein